MPKANRDYDNVIKTLKHRHKRLFVPVINQAFNKNYPVDTVPKVLSTDSVLENPETGEMEGRESDLFFDICGDKYLIEFQSYNDGSMAIRIAEYSFMAARNTAEYDNGTVTLKMPYYTVVYVKSDKSTPKTTKINFEFPDGTKVDYDCENVLLSSFSKEEIIEKQLYPYIPYYITRYEKEIVNQGDVSQVIEDLEYFREELTKLFQNKELSAEEIFDIMRYVNKIIKHISDGNDYEERMLCIMGGKVEETPSQELKRTTLEKTALSLFSDDVDYDIVRRSIPSDIVDDKRLKEIMQMTETIE